MVKVIFLFLVLLSPSAFCQVEFNKMVDDLLAHSVDEVHTEDLNLTEDIVLLDAREKEEFEVSHLKNAHWVGYNTFRRNALEGISKDQKIVVYCSVGYRSEKIAERLIKMGYKNVSNLYGGIFSWVNEGKPVFTETHKPTEKVHAYNEEWGKWLVKGEKIY
ncbi:rhodanese-like domain-containing protein [Flexithrix dorotheae]|uniref:rhodanese-like domain-containing protein n=1 Tax=Flexithrix dorotheae TaxID=70993 RepID=UPI000475795A|nr:rhodanese-like domain-containing protein [Flexithrix dorotheae]